MATGNVVKQEPQEWPPLGWLTKEVAAIRLGLSESRTAALAKEGKLQDWKQRNPQSKTGQMVTLIRAGDVEKVLWEREHPEEVSKLPTKLIPAGSVVQFDMTDRNVRLVQKSEKPWITIDEAAEVSGLPKSTIETLIKEKRLPALDCGPRPGGRWRVKRADLEKLEGICS